MRYGKGKRSEEYAEAVTAFLGRLVSPKTGELVGERARCPGCSIGSALFELPYRFLVGCQLCGELGIVCPGCRGAGHVRLAHAGSDDPLDTRPAKLAVCPLCLGGPAAGIIDAPQRLLVTLERLYRAEAA